MLFLIGAMVLLVIILLVVAIIQKKKGGNPLEVAVEPPIDCCGAHDVCEADSLLNSNNKIIYYDDEELDRFRGRNPQEYSDEEVEEFQDVLMTMSEAEVASWLRSLTLRMIELPSVVKQEALLIVEDLRERRLASNTNQ